MKLLIYFLLAQLAFSEEPMSLEKTASEPASWSDLFKIPEPSKTKQLTTVAERDAYWAQTDDAMGIDASVRPYENLAWPAPVTEPMTVAEARAGLDFMGLVIPPLGPFADFSSGILAATNGQWVDAAISAVAMVPALGDSLAVALRVGRKIPVENLNASIVSNAPNGEMTEFISDLNNSTIWVSNAYMDEMEIARIIGKVRYAEGDKRKIVILSGADGSYGGTIMTNKSYLKADQNRFGTMENVEVIDITKLDTSHLKKVLEQPDSIIISGLCNGIQCLKNKLQ